MSKRLTDRELVNVCENMIKQSIGYDTGDISSDRASAMDYYLGEPFGNEIEGTSQVVSHDVQDTIEWMMPSLMDILEGSEEIVAFDPAGNEDEEQAQQETDYVNYVFDKQNSGFLQAYSFIKDALIQKNGILKIYWDETEKKTREAYYDKTDAEVALILQDSALTPIEFTRKSEVRSVHNPVDGQMITQPQELSDIVCERTSTIGQVRVEAVPPEEFLIVRSQRTLDLSECDFCAHKTIKTITQLLEMGFDKDVVKTLSDAEEDSTEEDLARYNYSDEQIDGQDYIDDSMRRVTVYECYVMVDYNGRGKAELRHVTISNHQILQNYPCDSIPFIAATPVILTHKFFGLSIADLVMDIQKIKSTILRQMLDNLYQINNHRVVVNEAVINLDDAMISRPGNIIRSKGSPGDNYMPVPVQNIGGQGYQMLEYLDAIRTGRTGVSEQSMGLNPDVLMSNNKGDSSVTQMLTMSQQRIKLIARIFAETGFKYLFLKIHELLLKHQTEKEIVKLRGRYVLVDPTQWKTRSKMTVKVGLGTGDRKELQTSLMGILNYQQQVVQGGGYGTLVTDKNIYNALKDLAYYSGIKTFDQYFTNPNTPEYQQAKQQQMQKQQQQSDPVAELAKVEMAKVQQKAQADHVLSEIEIEKVRLKAEKDSLDVKQKQFEIEQEKAKLLTNASIDKQKVDNETKKIQDEFAYKMQSMQLDYDAKIKALQEKLFEKLLTTQEERNRLNAIDKASEEIIPEQEKANEE